MTIEPHDAKKLFYTVLQQPYGAAAALHLLQASLSSVHKLATGHGLLRRRVEGRGPEAHAAAAAGRRHGPLPTGCEGRQPGGSAEGAGQQSIRHPRQGAGGVPPPSASPSFPVGGGLWGRGAYIVSGQRVLLKTLPRVAPARLL